jgi:hypothetical protein
LDLTKVLRMPGTVNFKYTKRPIVRLKWWCEGPVVSLRKYNGHRDDDAPVNCGRKPKGDARAILKKYKGRPLALRHLHSAKGRTSSH